jgi:hypothetical protein
MPTNALADSANGSAVSRNEGAWPIQRPQARPVRGALDASGEIDAVQALLDLDSELEAPAGASLADQLLDFLSPQPRDKLTLTHARIVPLLGLAADLIGRISADSPDIVNLGSAALEQELRMQRMLADKRATLINV